MIANILWVFPLCNSHSLSHLVFTTNVGTGSIIVPVTDEETEAQECEETCPGSQYVELRFKPRKSDSRVNF